MSGVNKVILIGNLGRDPELRHTQGGTPVCNFSIAVNETWTKDGEKHERVEWVNIIAWNKLAELCDKYLRKGSQVYVEGRLQTREWEDNEGIKRRATEVVAQGVTFLGSRSAGGRRDDDPPPPDDSDSPPF